MNNYINLIPIDYKTFEVIAGTHRTFILGAVMDLGKIQLALKQGFMIQIHPKDKK
jgi:hypothetical protein